MKRVTILSGKGGVGKSSITASLAVVLAQAKNILCVDCDVDAANLALVLGIETQDFTEWKEISTSEKAYINYDLCSSCQACWQECFFHAIEWKDNFPHIQELHCEGCGVCELVCPEKAIQLREVRNAKIGYAKTSYGFFVVSGQLKMGESSSGKIVVEVKKLAESLQNSETELMLLDAAAGIGCPVIASVSGSDYVIAVTEPTPSGFSDLQRALELVHHFQIPCGLILNKYDINLSQAEEIESFAKENKVFFLGKIPYNRCFIEALLHLKPVVVEYPYFLDLFKDIGKNLDLELNKLSRK